MPNAAHCTHHSPGDVITLTTNSIRTMNGAVIRNFTRRRGPNTIEFLKRIGRDYRPVVPCRANPDFSAGYSPHGPGYGVQGMAACPGDARDRRRDQDAHADVAGEPA